MGNRGKKKKRSRTERARNPETKRQAVAVAGIPLKK